MGGVAAKEFVCVYDLFMPPTLSAATSAEPSKRRWIFLALGTWNLLLAISFPIQANILAVREGFYSRSIWFSLLTEMIGLYPHPGYLLAWPSRQIPSPGFSHITWDASGVGGIYLLAIVSFSSFLAVALFFRKRWAGYIAAFVGLLVAAAQIQQVHFPEYRLVLQDYRFLFHVLDYGMATGAFEKLIASLISAILALTLLRVLLWETIRGKTGAIHASSIG